MNEIKRKVYFITRSTERLNRILALESEGALPYKEDLLRKEAWVHLKRAMELVLALEDREDVEDPEAATP